MQKDYWVKVGSKFESQCCSDLLGNGSRDTSRAEKLGILTVELFIGIDEPEVCRLKLEGGTFEIFLSFEQMSWQGVLQGNLFESDE